MSGPGGKGDRAGIVEAVGGSERAATLLELAAGRLPQDVASRARSLAKGLRAHRPTAASRPARVGR